MPQFRDELLESGASVPVRQFDETDQLIVMIGADEVASFQMGGIGLAGFVNRLAKVLESSVLADGRFVVDLGNTSDQLLVETGQPRADSHVFRFSDPVSRFAVQDLLEPVLIVATLQNGEGFPFHVIVIVHGSNIRWFLAEREDVSIDVLGSSDHLNGLFRADYVHVKIIFKRGYSEASPLDCDIWFHSLRV